MPDFVKDLEAVEDEAFGGIGWPLTTAGTANSSEPIEVEVVVTLLVSLARSFVECRALAALDHLVSVNIGCRFASQLGGPIT